MIILAFKETNETMQLFVLLLLSFNKWCFIENI